MWGESSRHRGVLAEFVVPFDPAGRDTVSTDCRGDENPRACMRVSISGSAMLNTRYALPRIRHERVETVCLAVLKSPSRRSTRFALCRVRSACAPIFRNSSQVNRSAARAPRLIENPASRTVLAIPDDRRPSRWRHGVDMPAYGPLVIESPADRKLVPTSPSGRSGRRTFPARWSAEVSRNVIRGARFGRAPPRARSRKLSDHMSKLRYSILTRGCSSSKALWL